MTAPRWRRHKYQRVVGGQSPQARGADDGGQTAVVLPAHVKDGREQHPHLVGEIGAALPDDVTGRDDVHKHRRLRDRSRLGAAPDDDYPLAVLPRQRRFRLPPKTFSPCTAGSRNDPAGRHASVEVTVEWAEPMLKRTIDAERRLRELPAGARRALPPGASEAEVARLADEWYAGPTADARRSREAHTDGDMAAGASGPERRGGAPKSAAAMLLDDTSELSPHIQRQIHAGMAGTPRPAAVPAAAGRRRAGAPSHQRPPGEPTEQHRGGVQNQQRQVQHQQRQVQHAGTALLRSEVWLANEWRNPNSPYRIVGLTDEQEQRARRSEPS